METFSAEDILIDNLSFKLNKGASYINERRSVSFFPSGSNIYKPSSGNRVLKIALNAEDNSWLDPQSVMVFFQCFEQGKYKQQTVTTSISCLLLFQKGKINCW